VADAAVARGGRTALRRLARRRYAARHRRCAVAPASARQEKNGYRIGQTVRHARFGEGVIIRLEGSGTDARAKINFGAQGVKELLLAIAKLETA
jgi:hypothetical protein